MTVPLVLSRLVRCLCRIPIRIGTCVQCFNLICNLCHLRRCRRPDPGILLWHLTRHSNIATTHRCRGVYARWWRSVFSGRSDDWPSVRFDPSHQFTFAIPQPNLAFERRSNFCQALRIFSDLRTFVLFLIFFPFKDSEAHICYATTSTRLVARLLITGELNAMRRLVQGVRAVKSGERLCCTLGIR
jgi:hypothetical protein